MKKIVKICAGASALIAGCGVFATTPTINVANAAEVQLPTITDMVQATNTQGEFAFKAINLPKTVNADDEMNNDFYIPYPSVSDSNYTVKINVKEGSNLYTHTIGGTLAAGETSAFTVVTEGEGNEEKEVGVNFNYYRNTAYSVYFTAESGDKIYSSSVYTVNVEGVKYTYDIEDISTAIPTVAGIDDKILLPTLTLLDANGNVEKDGSDNPVVAIPKLVRNNEEITVADNKGLSLEGGKYYFTAKELGTYTVSYSTEDYTVTPQEIDIDVESWFDSSKVELEIGSLTLSNVDLNIEKELPTAKVSDIYHTYEGSTNVPHSTIITVINEDNVVVDTLTGDEIKSYTFKTAGKYKLEYKVSSLYLNNVKEDTKVIENIYVSDKTAPTIYLVKDYDTTVDNWESDIDSKKLSDYAMPSRVGLGDKDNNVPSIIIPAIYAEDKGSAYAGLTLQRTITGPDNKTIVLEDTSSTGLKADPTKEFKYNFTEKGFYTIKFVAIDENGKSTPKEFKVEVVASQALSYTEDTNLKITLPTINNAIASDEVKTVKVDSASDDKDKIIETHYYFYFGEEGLFDTALKSKKPQGANEAYNFSTLYDYFNATNPLHELKCEDNKLAIDIKDYYDASTSGNVFTIVAVAINDQGQFVTATEEVNIKNTSDDVAAPTMSFVAGTGFEKTVYTLGEDQFVNVPIAEFSDKADLAGHIVGTKELTIDAKYYIDNITNGLNGFNISYEGTNSIGGTIELSKAGTYYVIYTATDDAGNSYDYVTSFKVERKSVYTLDVEYTNVIDVFGSTEINATVIDQDGKEVTPDKVKVVFNGTSSPKKSGTNYTFEKADDYTFIVIATVGGEEIKSGPMTIKVKDLAYKWVDESALETKVTSSCEVGGAVNIVVPTYTYGGQEYTADVKVVDPNGEEVELTYAYVNGVKGDASFVATEEGKYTTTFTSPDGKLKADPIYTYVGDNNRPTISISNKDSVPTSITYQGEDITLTVSKTATHDIAASTSEYNVYKVTVKAKSKTKGEIYSRDLTVKLFDINGEGASVPITWADAVGNNNLNIKLNNKSSESTSDFKWTISSKGEYTLSIVATDENDRNSYAETITFDVVEKSATKDKKDNKAGIVLIVVALVLLAGIVCFFAFAGKSPKSKKVKPVKVEEKKDQEKDNQ